VLEKKTWAKSWGGEGGKGRFNPWPLRDRDTGVETPDLGFGRSEKIPNGRTYRSGIEEIDTQ